MRTGCGLDRYISLAFAVISFSIIMTCDRSCQSAIDRFLQHSMHVRISFSVTDRLPSKRYKIRHAGGVYSIQNYQMFALEGIFPRACHSYVLYRTCSRVSTDVNQSGVAAASVDGGGAAAVGVRSLWTCGASLNSAQEQLSGHDVRRAQ